MSATLPKRFTIRSATLDDVETVAALLNACSVEQIGKPHVEPHKIRSEWQSPSFDLGACTRVVLAPEGKLVGYVEVWEMDSHAQRFYSWGRVHPEYEGRGIGTVLIQWAEKWARRTMSKAPRDARVVLVQDTLSTDAAAQELLRSQDYRLMRHGFRMVIEMDSPPPEPVVPHGLIIRPFIRGQEERAILLALREAFEDHWGYVERPLEEQYREWMHWIESDPDFDPLLWFVAIAGGDDGEEIVGVSLCQPKTVEDPEMGWVNVFSVRRLWRRRGLPQALLHYTFGEFYRRDQRRVGLGVDARKFAGATRLYKRAGMRVDRQYVTYEKELRPAKSDTRPV